MSRPRLYVARERWCGPDPIGLEPAERRHLIDVLRLAPGAAIELFDGQGGVGRALLEQHPGGWQLRLVATEQTLRRRPVVRLGVALLKGRKLDDVIRMVTELGVDEVWPFVCRRSVPRPEVARFSSRLDRFRTIAAQAARQSGRARVPRIGELVELEELLSRPSAGLNVLLHEGAAGPGLGAVLLSSPAAQRTLLVGPEGGFSAEEVEGAAAAGKRIAGFDLPILRAETAAVVAAAFACGLVGADPDRLVESSS